MLGLAELAKPAALAARGGVWFACGAQQLHVGVAADFAPAAKAHPAFAVGPGGLDALAERLTLAGAPVHWDDELAGVARFYTEDPWGNRLELLVPSETGVLHVPSTCRRVCAAPPARCSPAPSAG